MTESYITRRVYLVMSTSLSTYLYILRVITFKDLIIAKILSILNYVIYVA